MHHRFLAHPTGAAELSKPCTNNDNRPDTGLAAFADMLGTVGNSSGTGVLLAVGIMIQTYEAMGREQMMEMHPVLRGFFGGE